MLQWMGGSRRKVTTSRKSTQKRQKQYFEQKKRQQQTAGLENYADGLNTCGQHHENPRSLDILSLLNLETLAQECNSGCTNERENQEANASPVNYRVSKSQLTSLINKVTPRDSVNLEEAENVPAVYQVGTVSPKKGFSSCPDAVTSSRYYSLKGNGDKLDHWKTATEQPLSVLDLLADDGPNGSSEGFPMHEAHAVFSVEGLGEVGKETPIHSPQQPNRFFFNGCSSPPKALRRLHSAKNRKYIMDDLELEMDAVVHGINIPLGGSSLESLFNSRDIADCTGSSKSSKFSVKGCMPLDARVSQIGNFLSEEEYFYGNMVEKNEKTWNARSSFPDNNFFEQRECDIAWRNLAYQVDGESADFFRAKNHEMVADKAADGFNISESPASYFKNPASVKNYDFINLDGPRCFTVDGSLNFKGVANQPARSYFATEDAKDSMSLLSEDSCSSSAVRGDKANYSSNSTLLRQSMKKHGSEIRRSPENDGIKNIYADEKQYKDLVEKHRGKRLNVSGKHTRVLTSLRSKPVPDSNSTVQENSEPLHSWFFEEGYTSVDKDSGFSSFCITSEEREPTSLGKKFWSKDHFGAFSVPKLHPNTKSSNKRSKLDNPVECATSGSFFSEKTVFQQPFSSVHSYDSPFFSISGSRSRKPYISPVFKMEGVPPYSSHVAGSQGDLEFQDLSVQESVSKNVEDKSEFQLTDCRKFPKETQKEVSIGNNDLSSENGNPMDALDSKDSCSECKEAKDEIPELIERPEMRDSPEHSEEMSSALKEIPDKLERCINEKKYIRRLLPFVIFLLVLFSIFVLMMYIVVRYHIDIHIPLPSQIGIKGKEDTGPERRKIGSKGQNSCSNPSYQVMLESHVLQLLCVKKVPKEASEQDMEKV